MTDVCCCTLVQTHSLGHTRHEPCGNHGLEVVRACQCSFVTYGKCISLVGGVDAQRGNACAGERGCGRYLYLPLTFAVNLKLF